MSDAKVYPLGYSDCEAQRLTDQAAVVEALTEDVFRRAGIEAGMHILDIGSGMGDVSLLAAKLVGEGGAVLGIDKAGSSDETARRRAAERGIDNVAFEEADIAAFETDRKFDAIVGRFVLLYIPERARILRKLTHHLREGGIVAFVEPDLANISEEPPSDLFVRARQWMLDAFAAGGAEVNMGSKLYATFRQAGLPVPGMITNQIVATPSFPGYEHIVQALRSLLPAIERNGIATAAEIGLDTLADRLRADALANDRVVFMSRIVGAWARAD